MNTLHKFAVLTLSAVLTVCLLAGCGASASSTASSAASDAVSSVASSVAASEVASSAAAVTDGEKLSTALAKAGIISQEEADAGFVTTVNGETADYNKDQAWWCLTDAAGEMTTVGVADIELHDGDSYAFTYTKG